MGRERLKFDISAPRGDWAGINRREEVEEAIRSLGVFTLVDIMRAADVHYDTARRWLKCLRDQGAIEKIDGGGRDGPTIFQFIEVREPYSAMGIQEEASYGDVLTLDVRQVFYEEGKRR